MSPASHRHSFVAVRDVSAFAAAAVGREAAKNSTVVIGGPQAVSWTDVVRVTEDVAERQLEVRYVEPGEDPASTAARELAEELGLTGATTEPVFLTVTETVGVDAGHTDVTLWYPAAVGRDEPLRVDEREFAGVRWWSRAELAAADPARFEPHLARYLAARDEP